MPGKQASRLRPHRRRANRNSYHRLAFRRRDACSPRLRSVHPSSEEVTNAWRFAGGTPALLAAQSSPFLRGSYQRLAFRRRDACSPGLRSVHPSSEEVTNACALCGAKRLRRLPGCAALHLPMVAFFCSSVFFLFLCLVLMSLLFFCLVLMSLLLAMSRKSCNFEFHSKDFYDEF